MEFTLASSSSSLFIQTPTGQQAYLGFASAFLPPVQLKAHTSASFFDTRKGIYLGDKVVLQVLINGQYKFMNITGTVDGIIRVVPADTPSDDTLTMTVLRRKPVGQYIIGGNNPDIILTGVNIILGQPRSTNVNVNGLSPNDKFIYSVGDCNTTNNCNVCGTKACPGGFLCSGGVCQTSQPVDLSLGLRYSKDNENKVLTISRNTSGKYIFNYVSIDELYPNYTSGPVETWLFADFPLGTTEMEVGLEYPLYILSGTTKLYFTNPTIQNGATLYDATPNKNITSGILSIKPRKTGNWRTYTFSTQDFTQLSIFQVVSDEQIIALWENPTFEGKAAVVPKKTNNGGGGGNNGGNVVTKPLYEEWWFWLIIGLIIVVLIAAAIGIRKLKAKK